MKKVIFIEQPKEETKKPVEFTHYYDCDNGYQKATVPPRNHHKVVYLGNCSQDGDMFAAYQGTTITIYKGHLNSGEY